ncbi:MAG: hypothetical protein ABIR08_03250 [Sphingomonas sp.]
MIAVLFIVLWLGVCGYALWRGGQPERFVAIIFLVAAPLSSALYSGDSWQGMQFGIFAVDVVMFGVLLVVALRANRYWPIAIAAMQLLQIIGQLLKLADRDMPHIIYWISAVVWAYPMLILLLLGTLRHRNREKRLGPEPSWSNSSPPPG